MLYSSYSGSPTLCDSTLFDGRKGLVSEYLPRERVRESRNLWAHDAGWTATSSFWISSRRLDFSIVSCLTTRLRLGLVFSELSSLVAVRCLSFAGSIYQLCDDRGTVKYTQRYRRPRPDSIYRYTATGRATDTSDVSCTTRDKWVSWGCRWGCRCSCRWRSQSWRELRVERELQSPKGDSEMQLGSSESIKLMPQIELKRVNDDV